MNEHPDLFEQPSFTDAYARASDPETSRAAAKSMESSRLEEAVYQTIRSYSGGLTSREVAAIMGIDWGSISPRFAPLCRKARIKDSGERRKGASGRSLIVWVIR